MLYYWQVMELDKEYVIKVLDDGSKICVHDVHKVLLEMLKDFDALCQKYKIPYYLTGGSCLGAVRHYGFIPWDDDADVGMLYEDYLRFLKACEKELPNDKYYYQCFDTHKEYNVLIPAMKFRKKHTYIKEANSLLANKCHDGEGIFLDVFIVDYVSENKVMDFLWRIPSYLYMPLIVLFENLHTNPLWLKRSFMRYVRRYGKISKKQGSKMIGYDLTWLWDKPWQPVVYRKDDIYPVQYHKFEDTMLPIPKHPDALLKVEIKGDYMSFPKSNMQAPKHIVDIDLHRKDE